MSEMVEQISEDLENDRRCVIPKKTSLRKNTNKKKAFMCDDFFSGFIFNNMKI